jgi:outer membrane protein assembly factor BamB
MTGKSVWRATLDGAVYARPVNTGRGIAVATGNGQLYLLDASTGRLIDRKKLDDSVRAGLAIHDSDLWVTTEAGTLYQFWVFDKLDMRSRIRLFYPDEYGEPASKLKDLNPGARRYDALGGGKYSVASLYSAPLVREKNLIVGFVRQTYYNYPAVAAMNRGGGILWYGTDEKGIVSGFGNVRFMPAYHSGLVILGNPYSNRVYALSETTGKTVWQTELGQEMFQHWSAPVVSREFVYVARHDGFLHKLRAADGTRVWSIFLGLEGNSGMSFLAHEQIPGQSAPAEWKPVLAKPIFATPAVSGNLVAVGTDEGYLYLIKDY